MTAKKVLNGELPATAQPDRPAEQERAAEPATADAAKPREAAAGPGAASVTTRDT